MSWTSYIISQIFMGYWNITSHPHIYYRRSNMDSNPATLERSGCCRYSCC